MSKPARHVYGTWRRGCAMSGSKDGVVFFHGHPQGKHCFFDRVSPQPISWRAEPSGDRGHDEHAGQRHHA
jgi:hypothetical protein